MCDFQLDSNDVGLRENGAWTKELKRVHFRVSKGLVERRRKCLDSWKNKKNNEDLSGQNINGDQPHRKPKNNKASKRTPV